MRAGKLRHLITIQVPADTTDAIGDAVVTFSDGPQVWGSIEPLQGKELWYAQQTQVDVTHKITLRYTSALSGRHRLKWQGRVFECGPPLTNDERGIQMVITAIEITARQ